MVNDTTANSRPESKDMQSQVHLVTGRGRTNLSKHLPLLSNVSICKRLVPRNKSGIYRTLRLAVDNCVSGRTFDHVAHQILGVATYVEEFQTSITDKFLECFVCCQSNAVAVFLQFLTKCNVWLNITCCDSIVRGIVLKSLRMAHTTTSNYHNHNVHHWVLFPFRINSKFLDHFSMIMRHIRPGFFHVESH